MSASALSSRAIIGEFYKTLEADIGTSWVGGVSMEFTSDQDSETYKWLGQAPAMREWVGGRQAKGFRDNGITILNKHYESTLEVPVKDLRRDKTGQVMVRIREQAQRATAHWASLLSTLIVNGPAAVCYDNQYFFDTDHVEGENQTSQSNDLTCDISAMPCAVHGTATAPSPEEMQWAIFLAIAAILSFKDDQNEPMNETAKSFLVMVPPSLYMPAVRAVAMPLQAGVSALTPDTNVQVTMNGRLTSWTDSFAVFRTDGSVKPFIRQQETPLMVKAKAEGSDFEFDNDMHQYGIDGWRNVGYGYWQHGCYQQMV